MKAFHVWLGASLLAATAGAGEAEAPSIELLLYLAEWASDSDGRLVDPMDLPEDVDSTDAPLAGEPGQTAATKPEPPR